MFNTNCLFHVTCGIIFSMCLLISCHPEEVKSKSKEDDTTAYINQTMDSLGIVGAQCIVIQNDSLLYQKSFGYAELEHNVPMTMDNKFAVASISKLFSSTLLIELLEKNNRSVHEPVSAFLTNKNELPESWQNITLEQLLSHTSGIPDQIDYNIFLAPKNESEVIEGLWEMPFTSLPGEKNKYNATGFLLLRKVIEKLADKEYESFIKQYVFDPLSLTSAEYGGFKKIVANRVTCYQNVNNHLELFPLNYSSPMYAAAGLNISAKDLAKWTSSLLKGDMISKTTFRKMTTPVMLTSNETGTFGWGWSTYNLENKFRMTGHGGAGISSYRIYFKERSADYTTVILLTNGAKNWTISPDEINFTIANIYIGDQLSAD